MSVQECEIYVEYFEDDQKGTAMLVNDFIGEEEQALFDEFADQGYVIRPVDDRETLDELRAFIVGRASSHLDLASPPLSQHTQFLDDVHDHLSLERLNAVRLALFREINEQDWLRPTYYHLAKSIVDRTVGNELAMQNKVNISVQIPKDTSSTLPLHADAFGGETPYQVVEWLPLVDCYDTKSMFILPRDKNEAMLPELKKFASEGMNAIMREIESEVEWLNVPYGHLIVFMPHLMHGNVINQEKHTRWSMNSRFTGLFTPYTSAEKKLGTYYQPITARPVTNLALRYKAPAGFTE